MEHKNVKNLLLRGLFKRNPLFSLLCIILYLYPVSIFAEIPPVGESVSSQSYATYSSDGNSYAVFSNEVVLDILPAFAPIVLPNGSISYPAEIDSAFSLQKVTFPFTITNAGNAQDAYNLNIIQLPSSDFLFTATVLYRDDDSDGMVDPGEQIIDLIDPVTPSETVAVVLEAEWRGGLAGGETAYLNIEAVSTGDAEKVDSDNIVRVVAREEARIPLVMNSDRANVMPEDTVTFTINYSNEGDRGATEVIITDFVDYSGNADNTEFILGSVVSTLPAEIEYYDILSSNWVGVPPPAGDIKGVRLKLDYLPPDAAASLSFMIRVNGDHESGEIFNSSFADYRGGDSMGYQVYSNEISVFVGRISSIFIGPLGNPMAEKGNGEDIVTMNINESNTSYTFWHEVLSDGNFVDTLAVSLSDSILVPYQWGVEFIDSNGVRIIEGSDYTAVIGALGVGESVKLGLRFNATPEIFRSFTGNRLGLKVEARSLFDISSRDIVTDLLVKADLPLISVQQSIKEPVASIGDVLSCILTVNNLTEKTLVDSLVVVETLCPGLGYAGGSIEPSIDGNRLYWKIASLEAGEKKQIIFRMRVKAGQQRGNLVNSASVLGVSEYGEKTSAGPAVVSIKIVEGIFTRKGIITGNVFIDSDSSGSRDRGEAGVAGVSVFMENGTYSITDSSGAYSIPGLIEGTHVLRIDPESLPDSLVPRESGHFGMGVGGEEIVNLAPSGIRRIDFPLGVKINTRRKDLSAAYRGDTIQVVPKGENTGMEDSLRTASLSRGVTIIDNREDVRDGKDKMDVQKEYTAMTFQDSHFDPGSAILREIPLARVAALSVWLREHPGWNIFIEGYTDSIPIVTEEFPSNLELSLARARSAFQLFRMNGIGEKKMDYTGKGAREPLRSNSTREGRAANRRVEVKIIPPEGSAEDDPGIERVLNDTKSIGTLLSRDAGVCSKIVKPEEGRLFRQSDRIEVEVVSVLGSLVDLYINNIPVGKEKIGRKEIDIRKGTVVHVFYGVKIDPGKNELLVVSKRHGGEKKICVRHVYLAGNPVEIIPERAKVTIPADGKSSGELVFLVRDKNGLAVRDGIFVDVEGPDWMLKGMDINPHRNGTQVVTTNGKVALNILPSREAKKTRISLRHDDISAGAFVFYESFLRDWFLLGYGEMDVGTSNVTGGGSTDRSGKYYHDGLFAEGKIALYGQGEIAQGHLMTVAVDTHPLRYDKLLDRIEPEKLYPIYGDASQLKFNSSSRCGTYVKMEHKRYSAMFGDFKTELGGMEFTRYERTFTGFQGKAEFDGGSINTFITRTDQVTYQEEIPADGTSGFYFLKNYPLIENSEKIRIEVRDRYRPEKIIKVDYKTINRDYDINYNDGSVLFKEPLRAVDKNLNPAVIIISYECADSKDNNFILGARSSVNITDGLKAGVTALLEEEGVENSSLVGVDLKGKILPRVEIESEFAHSEKFLLGAGDAFRVGCKGQKGDFLSWNAYYRKIDKTFFNPSFSGGKTELGSKKYGLGINWRLNRKFALKTIGFTQKFMERDEKKEYLDLVGVYTVDSFSGKAGLADISHSDMTIPGHSAVMMMTSLSSEKAGISGELRYDQKLSGREIEEYPNRLEAALSRRLWKKVSAELIHEYRTGSRSGARHRTRLGIESKISDKLNLFSRYSLEGAMSGERGQATIGFKNRFSLSDDLGGTFSAERLKTVSGVDNNDFTSLALSCNYTPAEKDYRLKGDYEIRFDKERTKHLFSIGGIKRMDDRWSGLTKGDIWFSDEANGVDRVKANSTMGLSLRPESADALVLLAFLKTRYEKNSPAHPDAVDKELLLSS
ncbi:OmpA family protein, partial [bacterium]|nr:OmpA family protein [bacterium]